MQQVIDHFSYRDRDEDVDPNKRGWGKVQEVFQYVMERGLHNEVDYDQKKFQKNEVNMSPNPHTHKKNPNQAMFLFF